MHNSNAILPSSRLCIGSTTWSFTASWYPSSFTAELLKYSDPDLSHRNGGSVSTLYYTPQNDLSPHPPNSVNDQNSFKSLILKFQISACSTYHQRALSYRCFQLGCGCNNNSNMLQMWSPTLYSNILASKSFTHSTLVFRAIELFLF